MWLIFNVSLSAQTFRLDSLNALLDNYKGNNHDKVLLMLSISSEYRGVDTAKSKQYALDAIKLAQKAGLKEAEAAACRSLAVFYRQTDTVKYRTYALEALRLAQSGKGMEMEEALAHGTLGNYYLHSKQYYLSYSHFKKAEKLFLKLNNETHLYNVFFNMQILFNQINDIDNQLYYANKLLEMAIKQNNTEMEIFARFSLGRIRFEDMEEQETLDYFLDLHQQAIVLNSRYTSVIAPMCAIIYLNQKQPRKALYYLNQVMEDYNKGGQAVVMSSIYIYLAEAYILLQQVDSAEYFLQKMRESIMVRDAAIVNVYLLNSKLDSIKGDHRSAFENYKNFHFISDSLSQTHKTSEISQIRNWYELEQKDNENELLQQEKQKQQKLIIILTGSLSIIFVLLSLLIFLYRKTTEKNSELKKMHSVKDKLFSVISHDLRSPMAALTSMLKFANKKTLNTETRAQFFSDISTRVDNTYSLLDNLLCWSKNQMQKIVPSPTSFNIRAEIQEIIDNSQNIAQAKNISLTNLCEDHYVFADRDMFAVIMRNLLTNAIKYSFPKGEVKISAKSANDLKMINISVNDNGIGMSQEVQDNLFKLSKTKSVKGTNNESGTGLGLTLCADFVKINGGDIWFDSKEGEGSTFFFSMPMKIDIN
ncbi:MAG: HAMP domain-containing histidine kinase [Marinilabiliaceae bacterium]|nr:HAMP domain-containing histidine kinase [Marinilabiliaceae bacterium]